MRQPRAMAMAGALAIVGLGAAVAGGCRDPEPPATPASSGLTIPEGTCLRLVLATDVTIVEEDVHDEGDGDVRREADTVHSEWWIGPDGTFVEQRVEDGLRVETYATREDLRQRVGGVLERVPERRRPVTLASAEDLVCLLGWSERWPALDVRDDGSTAIVTGAGRPERRLVAPDATGGAVRLESFFAGSPGGAQHADAVVEPSGEVPVAGLDGGSVPALLTRTVWGRGRRTETRITIESAECVGEPPGAPPMPGPLAVTSVERGRRPAANVVVAEHAGPLTDVPRVVAYVRRGLDASGAAPRGPFGLELERFADADARVSMRVVVPVHLPQDGDAPGLPPGTAVAVERAADVVRVACSGSLPRAASDLDAVLAAVRGAGAEPGGTIRILLPEDVGDAEPSALRFVAEVAVDGGD